MTFETAVGSPDPAVLATLHVGDICDIRLLSDPTRIAVVTRRGETLGAIVSHWEDLVGCMDRGFDFKAVIRSVSSPVWVLVQPAS